jgi:hypothetical protein
MDGIGRRHDFIRVIAAHALDHFTRSGITWDNRTRRASGIRSAIEDIQAQICFALFGIEAMTGKTFLA